MGVIDYYDIMSKNNEKPIIILPQLLYDNIMYNSII